MHHPNLLFCQWMILPLPLPLPLHLSQPTDSYMVMRYFINDETAHPSEDTYRYVIPSIYWRRLRLF